MTTDVEQLSFYLAAGYELIPLHKWDSQTKLQNGNVIKDGKRPLHSNWPRLQYRQQDMLEHMRSGCNIGVRLRRTDLIIDVDPRNFPKGKNSWQRFCEDLRETWAGCPAVATGSGGLHVYLTKPDTISIRTSLEGYPGLEFKSRGAQVVAAGSVHPVTGQMYRWQTEGAGPEDIPQAPRALLNLLKWAAPVSAVGGGEYSSEQLAHMLSGLDPVDFRDHDKWLQVLMASHHATAGEGRFVFIEWSTGDPKYADHADVIGRRWDSFHSGVREVTVLSLFRLLRIAGRNDLLPAAATARDFDELDASQYPKIVNDLNMGAGQNTDAPGVGATAEDAQETATDTEGNGAGSEGDGTTSVASLLERMNRKYCTVMDGTKFKVAWQVHDPSMADEKRGIPARSRWILANKGDFCDDLAHIKVQTAEGKSVSVAKAWLEYPNRRRYSGVVFHPEAEYDGYLNLWSGWAYRPNPAGSWYYLRELLTDVLCDGSEDVFNYVMRWSAFYVQNPGTPAEVALCFQGRKGVGKGTFGRVLANLAGRHGLQITQGSHLTGKFNAHLQDTVLLFADEVIGSRDREAEAQLKALITEPTFSVEPKGVDARQMKNCLHIVMASNESWFVPAGLENERRFVVQRANERWQGKHQKFTKLAQELKNGGYAALLHDLMVFPLEDWHPRMQMPVTDSSVDQKLRNMTLFQQWWFSALEKDEYPFPTYTHADGFQGTACAPRVAVFKQDIRNHYADYCKQFKRAVGAGKSLEKIFASELGRMVPDLDGAKRMKPPENRADIERAANGYARIYLITPVEDSRKHFEKMLGAVVSWN